MWSVLIEVKFTYNADDLVFEPQIDSDWVLFWQKTEHIIMLLNSKKGKVLLN